MAVGEGAWDHSVNLPNSDWATVSAPKATAYLLSLDSEYGRPKASFFLRFGFSLEQWEGFVEALVLHGQQNEVVSTLETAYGVKYVVEGPLESPDGRRPEVVTIWQIDHQSEAPRLVTAYPIGGT